MVEIVKCSECKTVQDCKQAFGIFWREKSRGGEGCTHPFPGWPEGWRTRLGTQGAAKPAEPKESERRGREILPWF